jgi:beta-lactamase regulating signal transducer with metallopeptidase domain
MIAALMLYSIAVTFLLAVAAVAAEQLLRLGRRPSRFVWAGAMVAALGLTVARVPAALSSADAQRIPPSARIEWTAAKVGSGAAEYSYSAVTVPVRQSGTTFSSPRFAASTIPIASASAVRQFDRPLSVAWAALTLVFFGVILLSAARLARAHRRWSTVEIDGVPVRVSHDLGPAVIGILRYSIVLPKWSLELPPSDREMVLAHEREHARAGDPTLLFGATLLLALMPWNAGLWWIARRLRFAIELDCDRRVLRHRDPRAYGALLLDVSERTMGGAVPIAAMAEPVSLIERRIAAMTARLPRFVVLRAAIAGLSAVALVIVACSTPHPTPAPEPDASVRPPRVATARTDTAHHDYVTATIDTARPRTPPRKVTRSDSLRAAPDSALQQLLTANRELPRSATLADDVALYRQLLARVDSLGRLLRENGGLDSVGGRTEVRTGVTAGGRGGVGVAAGARLGSQVAAADGGPGATFGGPPAGGYGGGAVMIGIAHDSFPRVTVGAREESGSLRRTGAPPPQAMVAGFDVGTEYTVTRSNRIIEVARAAAERFFPKSFAAHEGEFDMVTVVFDTTGAIVKTGRATRAPLGPDDRIADREQLRATLPGVSIESFSEWGMANLTLSSQSRSSGVMLLYAFRK